VYEIIDDKALLIHR